MNTNNSEYSISVCLLVYNHAHILSDIIDDILAQTINNFEFIISDDNSTDSSWEIIQKYAASNTNIKAIQTPKNLGMAGNSNFAVSKANGDFVALLHHDDNLDHTLIEKWYKVITKPARIGFVFNEYDLGNDIIYHKKMKYNFSEVMRGKSFLNNFLLKYWGCPVRGTAFIRKSLYNEIGGMDEKFGMLADVDLWMRLSAKWDVGYVSEPLIKVRVERPNDYPKDYVDFTWKRIFILFEIHSANINRSNYPNIFSYLLKRIVFKSKVNFEIIKWHIYALIKHKIFIITAYPNEGIQFELFYSIIIRAIIKRMFIRNY